MIVAASGMRIPPTDDQVPPVIAAKVRAKPIGPGRIVTRGGVALADAAEAHQA